MIIVISLIMCVFWASVMMATPDAGTFVKEADALGNAILFTGHSLGGVVASIAALHRSRVADTPWHGLQLRRAAHGATGPSA